MNLPTSPSFRLDNKTALITGASSGIGLGCAIALAEAGAHVVLAARNLKKLDEAVDAINKKKLSAEMMAIDLSDVSSITESIDQKGPFDILVNSAGLGRHAPSLNTSAEDFDDVINVNLRGAYFVTQAVARGLVREKKTGVISKYILSNGARRWNR